MARGTRKPKRQQLESEPKQWLEKQNEQQLRRWLLRSFGSMSFEPLQLTDEPSVEMQLKHLFEQIDYAAKEHLKNAVTTALAETLGLGYGTETVRGLAFLAAYIRATNAVDQIRALLDGGWLFHINEEEREDLIGDLISVVAGFSSLPAATALLDRLFFSDVYEEFAAQLFVGLCEGNPENYVEYVPRFIQLVTQYPNRYPLDYVFVLFVEKVGLRRLAANFGKLHASYQQDLLRYLCNETWSPIEQIEASSDRLALRALTWFSTDNQIYPLALDAQTRSRAIDQHIRSITKNTDTIATIKETIVTISAMSNEMSWTTAQQT